METLTYTVTVKHREEVEAVARYLYSHSAIVLEQPAGDGRVQVYIRTEGRTVRELGQNAHNQRARLASGLYFSVTV